MKTHKIGELILGNFKTEIHTTENVKAMFKKEKTSLASLIPPAWIWYDNELLETLDEDNDGKIDKKFGTNFKIIYFLKDESSKEFEQKLIMQSKTTVKNIELKYITLKCQK